MNELRLSRVSQEIDLQEGDVWGHRKDLEEYYIVNMLAASGTTADDVANQIQMKLKLGTDLIKYIARSEVTA